MASIFDTPAPADPFFAGNDLCWVHGEHYRVAKVLVVEADRVYLDGSKSKYWKSKESILTAMSREPVSRSSTW